MSAHTSRRSLIAKAAVLPILAMPGAAVAGVAKAVPENDPIFAALNAFDAACKVEEAGYEDREAAQKAFASRHGGIYPSGLSKDAPGNEEGKMNRYWLRDHSSICENAEKLTSTSTADLHRELNRQQADFEMTTQPALDAADAAFEKRMEAQNAVFEIVPTTLVGMRAKIEFAMRQDFVRDVLMNSTNECLYDFLDTLYRSAAVISGLPTPAPTPWTGEEEYDGVQEDDDGEEA